MPLPPTPRGRDPMTGEARFRRNLFGQLILQLEERPYRDPARGTAPTVWRDAGELDLWRLRATRAARGLEPLI